MVFTDCLCHFAGGFKDLDDLLDPQIHTHTHRYTHTYTHTDIYRHTHTHKHTHDRDRAGVRQVDLKKP